MGGISEAISLSLSVKASCQLRDTAALRHSISASKLHDLTQHFETVQHMNSFSMPSFEQTTVSARTADSRQQ